MLADKLLEKIREIHAKVNFAGDILSFEVRVNQAAFGLLGNVQSAEARTDVLADFEPACFAGPPPASSANSIRFVPFCATEDCCKRDVEAFGALRRNSIRAKELLLRSHRDVFSELVQGRRYRLRFLALSPFSHQLP
jgi:hypothetical protein